jgi:predicted ATPase
MKIKSISFQNYKAFKEKQTLVLKPITLLIGKNSSGKSSIAKLLTLLENSLSGKIEEPLLLKNNDVELGGEFADLFFGKRKEPISFSIQFEHDVNIEVSIIEDELKYGLSIIKWAYKDSTSNISLDFKLETGFVDSNGVEYDVKFNGILPTLLMKGGEDILPSLNLHLNIDVDYIGPFRILPERQFYLSGKMNYLDTGAKGENAYFMLGVSKLSKDDLHTKVEEWYKLNFDGWALKVEDENKPYIQILLSKDGKDINIVDVGQGMNQALPLITRASIKRPESIIVLEQPELHLHPAAHGDLAELFAKSAKENNQIFLIETHSENFILRLRKLIIENDFGLTKDDVIIYWVDEAENPSNGQEITEITINEKGVLSDWPEGVFTENLNEIKEMRKALSNKKMSKS